MTERITERRPDEQEQLEIEEWRFWQRFSGLLREDYGVRVPAAVCKHCGCRVIIFECTPWTVYCPLCRAVLIETVAAL